MQRLKHIAAARSLVRGLTEAILLSTATDLLVKRQSHDKKEGALAENRALVFQVESECTTH